MLVKPWILDRKQPYKPFMIMSRYTTNENVPVVVYLFSYDVGE